MSRHVTFVTISAKTVTGTSFPVSLGPADYCTVHSSHLMVICCVNRLVVAPPLVAGKSLHFHSGVTSHGTETISSHHHLVF